LKVSLFIFGELSTSFKLIHSGALDLFAHYSMLTVYFRAKTKAFAKTLTK